MSNITRIPIPRQYLKHPTITFESAAVEFDRKRDKIVTTVTAMLSDGRVIVGHVDYHFYINADSYRLSSIRNWLSVRGENTTLRDDKAIGQISAVCRNAIRSMYPDATTLLDARAAYVRDVQHKLEVMMLRDRRAHAIRRIEHYTRELAEAEAALTALGVALDGGGE